MAQRKLFLGARVKRLRRERGLNQTQMADGLGISASYLNHLERNQRPVTAGILLRLAEAFDVDVKAFASEGGDGGGADAARRKSSPTRCSPTSASPRYELVELADNAPAVAEGIARLYTAVRENAAPSVGRGTAGGSALADHARDLGTRLYPGAAQPLARARGGVGDPRRGAQSPLSIAEPLRQRLKEAWGVEVRVVGPEILEDASQHYDPQRRMLMLSSLLRPENRSSASPISSRCSSSRRSSRACSRRRVRPIPGAAGCCT